jgi:putative phosphoribosyl transferase
VVIKLNQEAYAQLRCEKEMKIVPRATHLFEEPGTLEEVAKLAAEWFNKHLRPDVTTLDDKDKMSA